MNNCDLHLLSNNLQEKRLVVIKKKVYTAKGLSLNGIKLQINENLSILILKHSKKIVIWINNSSTNGKIVKWGWACLVNHTLGMITSCHKCVVKMRKEKNYNISRKYSLTFRSIWYRPYNQDMTYIHHLSCWLLTE